MSIPVSSRFFQRPATRLGRWAAGLWALFIVVFIINSVVFMPVFSATQDASLQWFSRTVLPFFGIFLVLCGLGSGVAGLLARVRNREHSWLVWLTVLPGLFVLFLLIGEALLAH